MSIARWPGRSCSGSLPCQIAVRAGSASRARHLSGDRRRSRRERRDDLRGRGQAGATGGLVRECGDPRAKVLVLPAELVGGARTGLDEQPRGREQRIGRLVGLNRGERSVRLLDVGPGMAEEAHGAQMQERRARVSRT